MQEMEEELEESESQETRAFFPPFFNWGIQSATWGWITLVIFEQDAFLKNYLSYEIIAYISLAFVIISLILGVVETLMMAADWNYYGYIHPHVSSELLGSFSLANGLMLLTLWAYTMTWWFFVVAQVVFLIIRTGGFIHFAIKILNMKEIQRDAQWQLGSFGAVTYSGGSPNTKLKSYMNLKLKGKYPKFYFPFTTKNCYKIVGTTYETLTLNVLFIAITYLGSIALSIIFSILLYR